MKTKSIIVLLIFVSSFASQAQKPYSVENLEKLSPEKMDVYFNKAHKLQKDGKKVTKIGLITLGADVLCAAGIILSDNIDAAPAAIVGLTMYAALGTIAVGIPMKITGKKRVERINTMKNTVYGSNKIDVKPCAQYNLATQNYQPGITLKVKF